MITGDELRRMAARHRVSLGALEKDYILDILLKAIYADANLHDILALKGGAALRKVYQGQRLSLDLDFTAHRPIALDEMRATLEIMEISGLVKDHRLFPDALTIERLGFLGPLNHPNSVKVDVSFREPVLLPPLTKPVASLYFEPFPVMVFQLEEILAEKLRAALMRQTPRDYYDIWALMKRTDVNTRLLPELLSRKLEAFGVAYDAGALLDNLDEVASAWSQDLRELVGEVPDFNVVAADLRQRLAALPLQR